MKRDIYQQLLRWKVSPRRKPLIVRGARQVGKTFILREFAKNEYDDFLYLNFEDDPALDKIFVARFDKNKIFNYLSIYTNKKITPHTLIFFDEIQAGEHALNSLKYFNEVANEVHIVSAGSLLGVKLTKRQSSFPVGKVNFLELYPLSFTEFLTAINKSELGNLIKDNQTFEFFPETFHAELTELLKYYYFVGGMPEAVYSYSQNNDAQEVRIIHKEILDSYLLDFAKHATPTDIVKITNLWQSIPANLAKENKKYHYSLLDKKARPREYTTALQWLLDAGLIYKCNNISHPGIPLGSYSNNNIYKLFLLDVGLLSTMSKLSFDTLVKGNEIFVQFRGALAENYVAQQLYGRFDSGLYYWTSPGKAEVDFVFEVNEKIYPLEVKAGLNLKSKSLKVYNEKYHPPLLSRTSLLNFKKDENICNYPLYAISLFPL